MNYVAEIECIVAECRRRTEMLLIEIAEANRQTAEKSRELKKQWSRAAEAEEHTCDETGEEDRRESATHEQPEATACTTAAGTTEDIVGPVDDEDEVDAYYRRESWLV